MHGIGVKCCLASHRETVGQESEYQLIPQFRILIVSAVKICKRCLQTASVTAGLRPQIPYRRLAPGPHWGISIPQSHMKVPGAAIGQCAASLKLRQYGTIKCVYYYCHYYTKILFRLPLERVQWQTHRIT